MEKVKIEVIGKTYYTVELTKEDVQKVKKYLENKEDKPFFDEEKNFCAAVMSLYLDNEIELFNNEKCTESDFETEEINLSEYEDRSVEEILDEI